MIKVPCQHEFVMFITTFFFIFVSYDLPISWACMRETLCVRVEWNSFFFWSLSLLSVSVSVSACKKPTKIPYICTL